MTNGDDLNSTEYVMLSVSYCVFYFHLCCVNRLKHEHDHEIGLWKRCLR